MADVDLLAPLRKMRGGDMVSVSAVSGRGVIHIDPKWMSRTVAVGVCTDARSNLNRGMDPQGRPMPPLQENKLIPSRSGKTLQHQKRGIVTGTLMRSIVSENIGQDARVFVQGGRGQPDARGGGKSAAELVFVVEGANLFKANMAQRYAQRALQKVAKRIAGHTAATPPQDEGPF